MANRGGQRGNQNAAKQNREWSEAIRRVLKRDRKRLEKLALALLDKAETGDIAALKEFGDRYEGRVPQAIEGTGPGGAIKFTIIGA